LSQSAKLELLLHAVPVGDEDVEAWIAEGGGVLDPTNVAGERLGQSPRPLERLTETVADVRRVGVELDVVAEGGDGAVVSPAVRNW